MSLGTTAARKYALAGLPLRTIPRTVSSDLDLLGFCCYFPCFFVSVPCARLIGHLVSFWAYDNLPYRISSWKVWRLPTDRPSYSICDLARKNWVRCLHRALYRRQPLTLLPFIRSTTRNQTIIIATWSTSAAAAAAAAMCASIAMHHL